MKIVIEGMDGVGKSTVAKEVARRLGAKYVDGLLMGFLQESGMTSRETETVRKVLDLFAENKNSVIRTWIYGFANLFNLMNYDGDVVIDRHCITTFYYNGDENSKKVYQFMQTLSGNPDIVIMLRATEETRRARISIRNPKDSDFFSERKMAYGYDNMKAAAKFLNLNYRIVDTDDKDIAQVIDEVIEIIRGGPWNCVG